MPADAADRTAGPTPVDWREPVVRVVGMFHLFVIPPTLYATYLRVPSMFGLTFLAMVVAHMGAVLAAIFARGVRLEVRCSVLVATLIVACSKIVWHMGTVPGGILGLAEATIVVGLLFGGRAGLATLVVSGACYLTFGALGREGSGPRLAREAVSMAAWIRFSVTYSLFTGIILFVVVKSAVAVARGLEDTRRAEAAMRAALEAASASVWSLDAGTRAMVWLGGAEPPRGPAGAPPGSLEAYLACVPTGDRDRVERGLSEALSGKADTVRIEHGWSAPRGADRRAAIRARLAGPSMGHGSGRLIGTFEYAAREDAQRILLRLATSEQVRRGDLQPGLREVTEAAADLLGVDRCGVWVIRPDGGLLECADLWERGPGRHSSGTVLSTATYPAYFEAMRSERFIAADDARADPRTREMADDYLVPLGIVSMLDAPIHAAGRLAGVLCHEHVAAQPRSWTAEEQTLAGALADCASRVLDAAERASAVRALGKAYEELGQVARRMESAKEAERRHIARELHDELGQALTSIKLDLAMAGRAADPATAEARIRDATQIVDRALASTRTLSVALRPPLLDELGLVPALRGFLEDQSRRSTVALDLDAPVTLARLPGEVEISAFRIVQEAVTNALRYAEARRIVVRLRTREGSIAVSVRDDGQGFDPQVAARKASEGGHLGLVGMRERVRALGGTFRIGSSPGAGTEIAVEIPTLSAS